MTGKKRDLEKTKPVLPETAPLLLEDLRRMIEETRQGVAATVNTAMTLLYWQVGKRINKEILKGERAEYGKEILSTVSQELVRDYGKGFGEKNLRRMIQFAEVFQDERIVVSLIRQLSWTHIIALIPLEKPIQRDFYAEMCRIERWSVRTLRQKIDSMLYERTALSRKLEKLIEQELRLLCETDNLTPELVFRDPYLLELGSSGIHVAEYLTDSLPKEVLQEKLHKAIALARKRLENRGEGGNTQNVAKLLEGE